MRGFLPRFLWLLVLGLATGRVASGQVPTQEAQELQVCWRDVRAPEDLGTDLVFLSDGFRSEERAAFEASARRSIDLLERQTASFVRTDRDAWNVYVAFVPSLEPCPSTPGELPRQTSFGTHLTAPERGGLFESDDEGIADAAREVCAGVDCTVVLVRSDGAISFATGDLPLEGSRIRLPEGLEGLLLHELGHSLFGLGDEYVGHDTGFPEYERAVVPFYPNVTLDPQGSRFAVLVGAPVEVEEGALDFRRGVFRPSGPCIMQSPSTDRFCPVCASVIDAGRPAGPPTRAPGLDVTPIDGTEGAFRARIEPGVPADSVIRCFALLVRSADRDEADAVARFHAAHERLSRKTRYMESRWLGDGAMTGERAFSLEGNVTTFVIDGLEPGSYALVAAFANVLGLSPVAVARLDVP